MEGVGVTSGVKTSNVISFAVLKRVYRSEKIIANMIRCRERESKVLCHTEAYDPALYFTQPFPPPATSLWLSFPTKNV